MRLPCNQTLPYLPRSGRIYMCHPAQKSGRATQSIYGATCRRERSLSMRKSARVDWTNGAQSFVSHSKRRGGGGDNRPKRTFINNILFEIQAPVNPPSSRLSTLWACEVVAH